MLILRPFLISVLALLVLVPAGTPHAATTELAMYGCEMHYAVIPVPMDEAQAYLPDGYTPQPWLSNDVFPAANFFVLSQRCDTVTIDGATTIVDYHDILHGILVAPPPEHASPGIHSVLTGILTSDSRAAAVYESWGLMADADGDVTIETLPDGDTGFLGPLLVGGPLGVSYGTGDAFSLAIEIAATPTTAIFQGTPFRLHVPDGSGGVSHYAHYDIKPGRVQLGAATAQFPHGSPFNTVGDAGVAGIYTWAPTEVSQTMAFVPL